MIFVKTKTTYTSSSNTMNVSYLHICWENRSSMAQHDKKSTSERVRHGGPVKSCPVTFRVI